MDNNEKKSRGIKNNLEREIIKNQTEIENLRASIVVSVQATKELENKNKYLKEQLDTIKKEIKEYSPIFFTHSSMPGEQKQINRYNGLEQLKHLISLENIKQGFMVDWSGKQENCYIDAYEFETKRIFCDSRRYEQSQENELYFSEESAKDNDFINTITPFWLQSKGINSGN